MIYLSWFQDTIKTLTMIQAMEYLTLWRLWIFTMRIYTMDFSKDMDWEEINEALVVRDYIKK